MGTQDLVTLVPWTFIAQILNLFIQVYLIKKFLFKPVKDILAKRQALADSEVQKAVKAKEDAETMRLEYEDSMSNAKEKANEIITTAQSDAQRRSEEIISEANRTAIQIKNKAEADIQQEKIKAINDIKNEIGSIAVEIAGKVIEREVSAEDHGKLISEFIYKVGE
ncbi:MAG: F0F1 ATP synthase subunit B [Clostridia bacterium]|nr:F0F1 ATP synthase subunit B [Clostridia bacterium]